MLIEIQRLQLIALPFINQFLSDKKGYLWRTICKTSSSTSRLAWTSGPVPRFLTHIGRASYTYVGLRAIYVHFLARVANKVNTVLKETIFQSLCSPLRSRKWANVDFDFNNETLQQTRGGRPIKKALRWIWERVHRDNVPLSHKWASKSLVESRWLKKFAKFRVLAIRHTSIQYYQSQ